jgi:hypothetical protein
MSYIGNGFIWYLEQYFREEVEPDFPTIDDALEYIDTALRQFKRKHADEYCHDCGFTLCVCKVKCERCNEGRGEPCDCDGY